MVSARLQILAVMNNLREVRDFVRDEAATRVPQVVVDDVLLAVNEVVTNIIVHGYGGQPGMIDVDVMIESHTLTVRICDQAPLFDPTQIASPNLNLPLEQRPLGKMGIHLVRELMDEMRYRVAPGNTNELTLRKSFSTA